MAKKKKTVKMPYISIDMVDKKNMDWNVFVGARKIGKTFGILERLMLKKNKFIYSRRTEAEMETAVKKGIFNELNDKLGYDFTVTYSTQTGTGDIYEDATKTRIVGTLLPISVARKYRGVDFYGFDEMFYDEMIPENGVAQSSSDGETLLHALETIMSNRELPPNNLPPIRMWIASNPINLNDPSLAALNLIRPLIDMEIHEKKYMVIPERSLFIYHGGESEIADMKRKTSLYKMIGEDSEMASSMLDGKFKGDTLTYLSRDINYRDYVCVFDIDEKIYCYQHKKDMTWYFSQIKQTNNLHFLSSLPYVVKRRVGDRYKLLKKLNMVFYSDITILNFTDAIMG